jgi:hypothetical protein
VVMTPEQAQLREQLIKRYGELTFTRALEMSGIRCCLQALATDVLSPVERTVAYTQRRCISRSCRRRSSRRVRSAPR